MGSIMQKEKIEIEVAPETAEAYRKASPEARERVGRTLAYTLLSRDEAASAFRELTARTSAYAKQQGLTPEKLDALLSEDDEA
jgi:hypothetical protein